MAALQTSPPAAEPVCLDDVRAYLKVDHVEEDRLIADLIGSARQTVENMTGLSLVSQDWTIFLDRWPADGIIELPIAPVQSVTGINVYGDDGTPGLIDPSGYVADLVSRPARIVMRSPGGLAQPVRIVNGIGIELVAGFGGNGDAVPKNLRQAILQLVSYWFDNRSVIRFDEMPNLMPLGVTALLARHRGMRL